MRGFVTIENRSFRQKLKPLDTKIAQIEVEMLADRSMN